jgi:hypothetical protein
MSPDLEAIIAHFNVNVTMSDEVDSYINTLSPQEKIDLQDEMTKLIDTKAISISEISSITSFKPINEEIALNFFKAVYSYIFENGEEPDIDDYRPEWSI